MMHDPSRPDLARDYQHTLGTMRPDVALALARIIFQSDHRPALPHVRVPTLVLQSPNDAAVPLGVSRYLAHHVPGARWVGLDEAQAHHPHLSAYDAVNRQLDAFLTSVR
jgi:sigma-B regulation protein RsbQ